MDDSFPADLYPYPKGEWKVHDYEKKKSKALSTILGGSILKHNMVILAEEDQTTPWDNVLRGPIWNYGPKRDSGDLCYSDLLFGKIKKDLLTEEDKVIRGPTWIPRKAITSSFARQLFKKMKKAIPESTAMIEVETRRALTYKEVIEQAKSVASGLRWIGISTGHVIAVVSYNSLEAFIMVLASLLVGAVFALIDPTLNPADIGALLRISCPRLIFCECGKTRFKVETAMSYLITRRVPTLVINDHKIASYDISSQHFLFKQLLVETEPNFKPAYQFANPNNPLFILFTSGTTGTPKGALIPEKFFTSSYMFSGGANPMGGVTRYTTLLSNPIIWTSVITCFFLHLWGGHRIAFFRGPATEAVLIKAIEKYQVAYWLTGPVQLLMLLKWPARLRYTFLKSVFVAGSTFPANTLLKVQNELFGGKIQIYQVYGMTETGVLCGNTPFGNKVGSVGRVYFNIKMKVVEPHTNVPLGCCEEGELCFQLDHMMLGYFNNHEETRKTFDDQGYFHTGDLGFYDEQLFVYVTGRLKELIKWKGFHVTPAEVECVLNSHPAVKDALVFGLNHEVEGQVVTAAVTLRAHCQGLDTQVICQAVNEQLSENKKIRGGIYVLSRFPTTATGKIIKHAVIKEVIECKSKEERDLVFQAKTHD